MTSIQVDPKSAWALGEFRESLIELRLIDQHHQRLVRARGIDEDGAGEEGGIREEEASLIAYQGENLAGRLVVKLEDAGEPGEEEGRQARWRQFGTELNVELEITTETAARATRVGSDGALLTEEPSLWRDYEARENTRDRGVLARTNRSVRLEGATGAATAAAGAGKELEYSFNIEVQVPVEFLGQGVFLEAFVSPGSSSQREDAAAAAAAAAAATRTSYSSSGDASAAGGSIAGYSSRAGVSGGNFTQRLDSLFALSRVATVRIPVKRCVLPLRVVQPIAITSRCCPSPYASSNTATASESSGNSAEGGPSGLGLGRCLVALEVRNEHPTATVTLHDIEAHVQGTARSGDKASQRFVAPGNNRVGGRLRRRGGGGRGGAAAAPLEGLEGSIEQAPTGTVSARIFSRVFCASWVAKPSLPLELAPGEVQGFVLDLSPDPTVEGLLPRRSGGLLETPVTFVWILDDASNADGANGGGGGKSAPRPLRAGRPLTTSVHLAQWRAEERASDEVLVRVRGQPRVLVNRVFEVSLLVRNLSAGARDLVVMFTKNGDGGEQAEASGVRGEGKVKLTLDRVRVEGLAGGSGDSSDAGGDNEDDDEDGSNTQRSSSRFRSTGSTNYRPPVSPSYPTATTTKPKNSTRTSSVRFPTETPSPPLHHPQQAPTRPITGVAPGNTCFGDSPLLPVDAAVPLGRLERGAECGASVRLTAVRTGLARLSTLCLRDVITGAIYAPASPYEVFVE